MEYQDFELEIQPGRGCDYPVAVLHSPAGEARAVMRFPFDQLALENRLNKLQIALLRSGGRQRSTLSDEEQAVRDFGTALFDAIFTDDIRSRYDVSRERTARDEQGLRLKLRIAAPELAALPWEYLYDEQQGEYVCLSRNTPIIRYLELPQPAKAFRVTPPLRILGVIASPSDLLPLDVPREKERVGRAVTGLAERGLVELAWLEGQTWRDLQRVMQGGPWHILHFAGHGGFDTGTDEGYICLAGEAGRSAALSATQFGRLLADHRSLRLVVLNACSGARSGQTIFSSTAATLVRRGVSAVLAMQYGITDQAAIELARAFYEGLARGLPVDAAVTEARKAVSLAVANTVEWGTPVLYMQTPEGALFDLIPIPEGVGRSRTAPPDAQIAPTQSAPEPFPANRRKGPLATILAAASGLVILGVVAWLLIRSGLFPGLGAPPPTATITAAATTTATATPLYGAGVVSYVQMKDGKSTLYALQSDGTSLPLLADVVDAVVVATSPDHRYLAVAYSPSSPLSWASSQLLGAKMVLLANDEVGPEVGLDVVSADGTTRNHVLTARSVVLVGVGARFAAQPTPPAAVQTAGAESLHVFSLEADAAGNWIHTYYTAKADGSEVRQRLRSVNAQPPFRSQQQPVAAPTTEPMKVEPTLEPTKVEPAP